MLSNEDCMRAQRAHEEALARVARIRVTVEPSGYQAGRVCLKAVDNEGRAKLIVENILPGDACRERNQLLERLVSSGQYDEVMGDAIPRFDDSDAPLKRGYAGRGKKMRAAGWRFEVRTLQSRIGAGALWRIPVREQTLPPLP